MGVTPPSLGRSFRGGSLGRGHRVDFGQGVCNAIVCTPYLMNLQRVGLEKEGPAQQTLVCMLQFIKKPQRIMVTVNHKRADCMNIADDLMQHVDDTQQLLLDGAVDELMRQNLGGVVADWMKKSIIRMLLH